MTSTSATTEPATTPPSPHDDQAIRAVVDAASHAQNDPYALVELHRSDAIIVNFPGRRVLGRAALGEAMTAALASPLRDVVTEVEVQDIRMVTTDVALVSCVKTVHDRRADGDAALPASSGALTYVLSRTDGGWRIVLAQTTPILI
jgi:uncharacterized protein (TIGR02246 family)